MGYIKEPEGIEFTVLGTGLSETERKILSEHIQQAKQKRAKKRRKRLSQQKKEGVGKIS